MLVVKVIGSILILVGILIFIFKRAFAKFLIACGQITNTFSSFRIKDYDEKTNNGSVAIWFFGLYFIAMGIYLAFFA